MKIKNVATILFLQSPFNAEALSWILDENKLIASYNVKTYNHYRGSFVLQMLKAEGGGGLGTSLTPKPGFMCKWLKPGPFSSSGEPG